MGEESIFKVIGVIVLVIVGGVIGLICASFSDLQFYEMGFSKSKTTGAVNTAVVYKGGRRWIGPDKTFKIFDASAHDITLDDISVFAATDQDNSNSDSDGSTGAALVIQVSVTITYFLIPEYLKLLHDEYDVNYESIIESSAQAAIKDISSTFTLKQFYQDREDVETELLYEVQRRLGGICCPLKCPGQICFDDCMNATNCTDADKGLFVEARYLQMTDLKIPYEVEQRNLKTLIITEETAKESFTQQAAVIEKETEQKVQHIKNSALEVTANSTAQAALIAAKSQASYRQILEAARRKGLMTLFSSTGLSTVEHKNSFDYLRSLADNSNAHLTVDFDQLIMGPTKLP